MKSQRVGHDCATEHALYTLISLKNQNQSKQLFQQRGLGSQSSADLNSGLQAPCEGDWGLRGAGAPQGRYDPTPLPPGPSAGCRPLPHSSRQREMSNNKQQWSAVLLILFALISTLILCSPNSASEASHYSSLWGRIRQLVNLKKWGITDSYIPILAYKTRPSRCHQCDCHQLQPPARNQTGP